MQSTSQGQMSLSLNNILHDNKSSVMRSSDEDTLVNATQENQKMVSLASSAPDQTAAIEI